MPQAPFPKIGEIFELTASSELSKHSMAKAIDEKSQWGWDYERSFEAPPVGTSKRFKLVSIGGGDCHYAQDAIKELHRHGRIPGGVWLLFFLDVFGPHSTNRVGVADLGWSNNCPYDHTDYYFPAAWPCGSTYFEQDSYHCGGGLSDFLWIVEVAE